jgi:hypothetical protein
MTSAFDDAAPRRRFHPDVFEVECLKSLANIIDRAQVFVPVSQRVVGIELRPFPVEFVRKVECRMVDRQYPANDLVWDVKVSSIRRFRRG